MNGDGLNVGRSTLNFQLRTRLLTVVLFLVVSVLSSVHASVTNGLVGWWRLDEGSGSSLADASTTGNTGTKGGSWITNGVAATALSFTTLNAADIPYQAIYNLSNAITLAVWIKPSGIGGGTPGYSQFFTKGDGYFGDWGLRYTDTRQIIFQMTGMNGNSIVSLRKVPTNQWTQVVATFDGVTARLYLDGLPDRVAAWTGARVFTNTSLLVGRLPGGIDEPRIYNRALTETEVVGLFLAQDRDWDRWIDANETLRGTDPAVADTDGDGYADGLEVAGGTGPLTASDHPETGTALVGWWKLNEGSGTSAADSSGNGNAGAFSGSPTWVSGLLSNALQFSGSPNYPHLICGNNSPGSALAVTNLTIAYWTVVTNAWVGGPVVYRYNDPHTVGYETKWQPWYSRLIPILPEIPVVQISLEEISTNVWQHHAFTYDGQTVRSVLDGVEMAQGSYTNAMGDALVPLSIGYNAGKLDDVRVYNRGLRGADVLALALVDTDGDGMPDAQELRLGTNPTSADSDGDGMPDGWEVAQGLNPTSGSDGSQDSDGDGLTNAQEYQHGTDPQNSDTDGDGMPDGWEADQGLDPNTAGDKNSDADGDGWSNYWEWYYGTNPNNSNSQPAPLLASSVSVAYKMIAARRSHFGFPEFWPHISSPQKYYLTKTYSGLQECCWSQVCGQNGRSGNYAGQSRVKFTGGLPAIWDSVSNAVVQQATAFILVNDCCGGSQDVTATNTLTFEHLPGCGISIVTNTSYIVPAGADAPYSSTEARVDLSDEYTPAMLASNANDDLSRCGTFDALSWGSHKIYMAVVGTPPVCQDEWVHTVYFQTAAARHFPNGESDDLWLRKIRYRLQWPSVTGAVYRVAWMERFLSDVGAITNDLVRTQLVVSAESLAYTSEYEIAPPATNGSIHVVGPLLIDLDVDANRSGTVEIDADEPWEDSWSLTRGALVPPRNFNFLSTNDVSQVTRLVIRGRGNGVMPVGHKLRLHKLEASTQTNLLITTGGGELTNFPGGAYLDLATWPATDTVFYATSYVTRRLENNLPDVMTLALELVNTNNNTVVSTDRVALKVAPLILPPECNPAEAVYASLSGSITGIPRIVVLNVTNGDQFIQDHVKFTKTQRVSNTVENVFVCLDYTNSTIHTERVGDLDAKLRSQQGIPGRTWYVEGNGGNIMATPPLGTNAPYGKILIGSRWTESVPYWTNQNVQPVDTSLDTSWLAVGHVDEVIMFVATNKVLYADPWKAADLLHAELVAGNGTNTIWWGLHPKPNHQTNILSVVAWQDIFTGAYRTNSLPMDLPNSTTATNLVFGNHNFVPGDRLRVDDEILEVTATNGMTVTIARAQYGRPAQAHSSNSFVYALSDVMRENLPEVLQNSVVKKIEAVTNQLQQVLGSYAVTFVPMPVLFHYRYDIGTGGQVAHSANTVNCLLGQGGTVYYSDPGCAVFRNDIATHVPSTQAVDVWDTYHCENGEVHCGTAARRCLTVQPPWWQRVTNWE